MGIAETKKCGACGASFDILDEDVAFYDKISPILAGKKYALPRPALCPDCRQQQRLSFRNERCLYKRKCDLTGQDIISIYSPDKACKVYEQQEWRGDKWDAMEYGRDFDFTKPFFPQFEKLVTEVPMLSMINNQPENSAFCNQTTGMKDSYLCFNAIWSEDCYYCKGLGKCKDVVDSLRCNDCERCYECIDCHNCNHGCYLRECTDCLNCYLCKDCIGCENCFGCIGLVGKKYHIFNEAYPKEEYAEKVAFRKKASSKKSLSASFQSLMMKTPMKYATIIQSEDCIGDNIHTSKNAKYCYDIAESENVKFCYDLRPNNMESYDISAIGDGIEFSYNTISCGIKMNHLLFDINCRDNVNNIYYCNCCVRGCSNCFGCSGLVGKSYCIFNKQYTPKEYEETVAKIIEHMIATEERGQFPPAIISPFGYNETVAQEYYPLTKAEATQRGFKWSDYEMPFPKVEKILKASELPDIKDVEDDILKQAIECEITKKPFRIIKQELEFYRKNELQLPRRHSDQRHMDRMNLRNPRKLRERKCNKCGVDIKTSYAPERKEIVYCEQCYNKEIYG